MGETASALSIRRTTRHEISLPARVAIAPEHAQIVRFGPAAGARDGMVDAQVLDFASGGVGLISRVYLPRMCVLHVRLLGLDERPDNVLVDCKVRVQRVIMTDRRPAYMLGTAFEDLSEESTCQIAALIDLLEGPAGRETSA